MQSVCSDRDQRHPFAHQNASVTKVGYVLNETDIHSRQVHHEIVLGSQDSRPGT
jgi:hypothetical protein